MRKFFVLVLALGVSLSVMGCSKRSVEDTVKSAVESSAIENENVESSAVETLEYINVPLSDTNNFTICNNFPQSDFGFELANYKIPFFVYEYGVPENRDFEEALNDELSYLKLEYPITSMTSSNPDNKSFTGYQIIQTPSGKQLKYNFEYKFNEQFDEFIYSYYRLENYEDFFSESKKILNTESQIIEMKDDLNSEFLIPLFLEYMNEVIDREKQVANILSLTYDDWCNEPLELLNYIKGNFTNSMYDEYLVFFKQGIWSDGRQEYDDYIRHVRCFIMDDDNKIIDDYYFPTQGKCLAYNIDSNKDFSSKFFQGWVGDFNKNGINEVIIISRYQGSGIDILEFGNGSFKKKFLMDFSYVKDTLNYDWESEEFSCEYIAQKLSIDQSYIAKIRWSDIENCYIRVSNEPMDK